MQAAKALLSHDVFQRRLQHGFRIHIGGNFHLVNRPEGFRIGISQGDQCLNGVRLRPSSGRGSALLFFGRLLMLQLFLKGILQPELVLQLQNQLLRRFLSDTGRLGDRLRVIGQNGKPQVVRGEHGKNSKRALWSQTADIQHHPEHFQVIL